MSIPLKAYLNSAYPNYQEGCFKLENADKLATIGSKVGGSAINNYSCPLSLIAHSL